MAMEKSTQMMLVIMKVTSKGIGLLIWAESTYLLISTSLATLTVSNQMARAMVSSTTQFLARESMRDTIKTNNSMVLDTSEIKIKFILENSSWGRKMDLES